MLRERVPVELPGQDRPGDGATALGKNLRQIEELVSGHMHGDGPDDPTDPDLEPKLFELLLAPEVFARRQTQAVLADEHGGRLDDSALATAFCEAVLRRRDR